MKIDLDQNVIIDGKEVVEDKEAITYQILLKRAMLAPSPETQKLSGEAKYNRYKIAQKIDAKEELSVEEISLIKAITGEVYNIQVVGVIWDFLEAK
ncbi:MAG: hypothetical protein KAS32_24295 [Candidatus Peribacteraceae bacterium]|nr:hypothetical protein [Candidatus Peribacteraceae bacterium]